MTHIGRHHFYSEAGADPAADLGGMCLAVHFALVFVLACLVGWLIPINLLVLIGLALLFPHASPAVTVMAATALGGALTLLIFWRLRP
jgi:hypothetical protein